ncbi:MAG: hypothetical protein DCC68_20740 [Planctomycetota bacterium]|nr:MAG: hypothetical protein DCC68_20740 [Planctomycetota bacterium]
MDVDDDGDGLVLAGVLGAEVVRGDFAAVEGFEGDAVGFDEAVGIEAADFAVGPARELAFFAARAADDDRVGVGGGVGTGEGEAELSSVGGEFEARDRAERDVERFGLAVVEEVELAGAVFVDDERDAAGFAGDFDGFDVPGDVVDERFVRFRCEVVFGELVELAAGVGGEVDLRAVFREFGGADGDGFFAGEFELFELAGFDVEEGGIGFVNRDVMDHEQRLAVGRPVTGRPEFVFGFEDFAEAVGLAGVGDVDVHVFAVAAVGRDDHLLAVVGNGAELVARFAVGEQRGTVVGEVD